MKKLILCSIIAALTATAFCSCSSDKTSSKDNASSCSTSSATNKTTSASDTSSKETTEKTDKETSKTDSEASSTKATETSAEKTDYEEVLAPLLNGLNEIDRLGACAIVYDESVSFKDTDNSVFYKVSDTRFSETKDLREFMQGYITDNLIKGRYASIVDSDKPLYMDKDGALYVRENGKAGGFAWTDKKAEISDATDAGFTALKEYDQFGAPATVKLKVKKTADGYRVDALEFQN